MLSNWNALIITWALTAIIIIGGVTVLELTYDPPVEAATGADGGTDGKPDEGPADTPSDTPPPQRDPMPDMGPGDQPLTAEATPEMLEVKQNGDRLPRIANDGRTALSVYAARQPNNSLQPKIALILSEVGMNSRLSRDAIRALPAAVTVAISPYASEPGRWTEEARNGGHETLVLLPMEPYDYPRNNPGELSLLLGPAASKDNMKKLQAIMASTDRYIGLMSFMGSSFTTNAEAMRPVLTEISSRGLMFVDSRTSSASAAVRVSRGLGVPSAYANSFVDEELTEEAITGQLVSLVNRARTLGYAVGVIRPKPITVRTVNAWLESADERGFTLVPVSAAVDRQPVK